MKIIALVVALFAFASTLGAQQAPWLLLCATVDQNEAHNQLQRWGFEVGSKNTMLTQSSDGYALVWVRLGDAHDSLGFIVPEQRYEILQTTDIRQAAREYGAHYSPRGIISVPDGTIIIFWRR